MEEAAHRAREADSAGLGNSEKNGLTARDCAATELVSVTYGETLQHSAQLMAEHDITHLLVVDPDNPGRYLQLRGDAELVTDGAWSTWTR